MAQQRNANTAPATAARRRIGDNTAADRLRAHGWLVVSPETIGRLPTEVAALIVEAVAAAFAS